MQKEENLKNLENVKIILNECSNNIKNSFTLDRSNDDTSIQNNNSNKKVDSHILVLDQVKKTEGCKVSTDLLDLPFSPNDFSFGDCNEFEQASQLVDPAFKDSEGTPIISFNNNDLVQLFRFNINNSKEDSLNKKHNDLISTKNVKDTLEKSLYKNEIRNKKKKEPFGEKLEILDKNMNVNKELLNHSLMDIALQHSKKKNLKGEIVKKKSCCTIKKGRRYLGNFKQEVLNYTKNHTFKETALHFKINTNTITEWSREIKQISFKSNSAKSSLDSALKNHKTDITQTPKSKTELILFNEDIRLETEINKLSSKANKKILTPDEQFFKWIQKKRKEKIELTRQEVFTAAENCLKFCPVSHEKPAWFVMWVKRYDKVLNSAEHNMEAEKYIKYPVKFKLEAVLYAKLFTKNLAAKIFNVCRRRMFDWYKCFDNFQDSINIVKERTSSENQELSFQKKNKTKDNIYSELHFWYQEMHFNGFRPTSNDVKNKAKEIFSFYGEKEIKFSDGWLQKFCQRKNIKLKHSDDDVLLLWILSQYDNNVTLSHQEVTEKSRSLITSKKFKGSKNWTLRFLKRHRNLLQRSPTVNDQLPRITEEKLSKFWEEYDQSLKLLKIKYENIGCMDEIPLCFNYPSENESSNLPLLRKTGFENCQGIVILSALANGMLLPPTVVFKGIGPKQLLSKCNFTILILYQEKGLITSEVLETWVNEIWLSSVPTTNALIVDSFEPHRSIAFQQFLSQKNCVLHVIPNGCSSKFQPLNVGITPLFQVAIKNQWDKFPINENNCSTKLNHRYRCPDHETILRWVQNAFEEIKDPLRIKNAFKLTGLLQ